MAKRSIRTTIPSGEQIVIEKSGEKVYVGDESVLEISEPRGETGDLKDSTAGKLSPPIR